MKTYRLSSHVRMCFSGHDIVLLDLRSGEYLGVTPEEARILGSVIDHSLLKDTSGPHLLTPHAEQYIQTLLDLEILTQDRRGRSDAQVRVEPVEETLVEKGVPHPPLRVRDFLSFALACSRASLSLKFQSMEHIVNSVQARKLRKRPRSNACDLETARLAMSTFRRLRPILFAVRDACMFDSLALTHFLAGRGIYLTWVIGVRSQPFRAHSWVQGDEHGHHYVLNGDPETVLMFSPIVAV